MAHTNSTPNYNLPQFVTTDKPAWLTDINGAFSDIDTAIDTAKDTADSAQADATQALSDASAASTAASGADAKGAGAVASLAPAFSETDTYTSNSMVMYNNLLYWCHTAVTTPGPWTGAANWNRDTCARKFSGVEGLIQTVADIIPTKADKSQIAYKTANTNNIDFYRFGNVVMCGILTGTNYTTADAFIITGGSTSVIPAGYRPVENVNIFDTNLQSRLTANADGTIWTGKPEQNLSYRFTACWITTDPMPI